MGQYQTIIIQLGISALVVLVGYKIALKLIDKWASADSERTKSMAATDRERTQAIKEGFASDVAAHGAIVATMQTMQLAFARIEARIDTALDLTPVHGTRVPLEQVQPPGPESVIVDMPEVHRVSTGKTPPTGSPTIYSLSKRPKTSG